MSSVHVLQAFHVPAGTSIFDECDALMNALVDMEDEAVRDAAVSADAERGVVLVEVTATGADRTEAEIRALVRIHDALTERVGVRVVDEILEDRQVQDLAIA